MRILVVDDDKDLREMFVEFLRDLGYEADGTRDGFEAIEAGRAQYYDVVFSDINMPLCDGWTVARMIKEQSPETHIFLCTGETRVLKNDWTNIREVDRIFMKPLHLDEIVKLLDELQKPEHAPLKRVND